MYTRSDKPEEVMTFSVRRMISLDDYRPTM